MSSLIRVEWIRLRRNPLNVFILLLFALILGLSAVWSGLAARQIRAEAAAPQIAQSAANQAEMHDSPKNAEHGGGQNTAFAASGNRSPVQLPLLGGLVLNVSQVDLLGTAIKVSTRNRHTDGRSSDQLFNPLSYEFGLLDFASVFALITPLVIIALSYGLVQEERESGVWRLVCTQTDKPWRLVFCSLGLRWLLVWLVSALASALAFALDSGSSLSALGYWLVVTLSYALLWFGLAGLFLLLPISSGAVAIALLGSWLVLTFGIPAALNWAAEQSLNKPSRMATIIEIRRLQEQNNQQRQSLLADWYHQHPEIELPNALQKLPREISGLPASLQLDLQIRPLMTQFDLSRARQFEFMQRWSWTSPALGVALMADRLSGLDAPRYAAFVDAVNQFEDQWRAFFVPLIMAEAPWSPEQQANVPQFHLDDGQPASAFWSIALYQLATALAALMSLFALRKRFLQV